MKKLALLLILSTNLHAQDPHLHKPSHKKLWTRVIIEGSVISAVIATQLVRNNVIITLPNNLKTGVGIHPIVKGLN